jgi:hypothetical protein
MSSKTGQAPTFAGGSSDLKDVIPAVGAGFGIEDIGKAIEFYKKNQGLISTILALFGIGKKKPAPPVAATVPDPTTGTAPAPGTPPVAPVPQQRKPDAIRSGLFLVEKKNNPRKAGGGRFIADKKTFEEIKSGSSPARRGDRMHINTTPSDSVGDFMPGGRENDSLLIDVARGQAPNNFRIEHIVTGGGEVTSGQDDFACTPVILIPWEQEPGGPFPIDTGERWEMTYQAVFHGENGERFEGDVVRWLAEE